MRAVNRVASFGPPASGAVPQAGASPGQAVEDNGLGGLVAVLNPLWGERGGRVYHDERAAAAAARVDLPLGRAAALSAGYRGAWGRAGGDVPSRPARGLEALSARAVAGRVAVQAGRDAVWVDAGGSGLLLGLDGPPLDLIRVASERPIPLHVLGDLDFALFAADLGPRDAFPHAKLFGVLLTARPVTGLSVGLTLLNKQMGEGAPTASVTDRLKDLTFLWGWMGYEGEANFSEKLMGASLRYRGGGWWIVAESALTDFEPGQLRHTFRDGAAYRLALGLPRLGRSGRHAVEAEAARLGPHLYRHPRFSTGLANDGFFQGSSLGSDARGVRLRYAYHAPAAGWRLAVGAAAEERSGDVWANSLFDPFVLEVVRPRPDETRVRGEASWTWSPGAGALEVEVRGGFERVVNPGHAEGARRWNRAGLIRVSRTF